MKRKGKRHLLPLMENGGKKSIPCLHLARGEFPVGEQRGRPSQQRTRPFVPRRRGKISEVKDIKLHFYFQ